MDAAAGHDPDNDFSNYSFFIKIFRKVAFTLKQSQAT